MPREVQKKKRTAKEAKRLTLSSNGSSSSSSRQTLHAIEDDSPRRVQSRKMDEKEEALSEDKSQADSLDDKSGAVDDKNTLIGEDNVTLQTAEVDVSHGENEDNENISLPCGDDSAVENPNTDNGLLTEMMSAEEGVIDDRVDAVIPLIPGCEANVRVMHDFIAEDEDTKLSCSQGEILGLRCKTTSEWWYCQNEVGEKGYVPYNHVQIIGAAQSTKLDKKEEELSEDKPEAAQTFEAIVKQQVTSQLTPAEVTKSEETVIQIVAQLAVSERDVSKERQAESSAGLSVTFSDCPNYLAAHHEAIPEPEDTVGIKKLKQAVIQDLKVHITQDEGETSSYHETGGFSLKDVFNAQLANEVPREQRIQVRRQQRQAEGICELLVTFEIEQQQDIEARLTQVRVELDIAVQVLEVEEADAQARLKGEATTEAEALEDSRFRDSVQTVLSRLTQRVATLEEVVGSLQSDLESLSHKADYLDAKQVNERVLQQREREGQRRLLMCQQEILDGDEAVAQYYLYLRTYLRGFLLGIGAGCSPLVKLETKTIADLLRWVEVWQRLPSSLR